MTLTRLIRQHDGDAVLADLGPTPKSSSTSEDGQLLGDVQGHRRGGR